MTFLTLLAALSPQVAPPRPQAIQEVFDVRYHAGSARQVLDIFSPAEGRDHPVVVFVHGGTWMAGDKNFFGSYRNIGRFLAGRGVVAVLINYRLSPFVRHPEHVIDVARAVSWTSANIRDHGGDPSRLFVAGHSARAHLVSLLAVDDSYWPTEAKPTLRGVVSMSGVPRIPDGAEYRDMRDTIVDLFLPSGNPAFAALMRPAARKLAGFANPFPIVFGDDKATWKQASPLTHVRKGLPPFLVYTAEAEVPGLRAMNADFVKALTKAGNEVEAMDVPDCEHKTIMQRFHSDRTEAARLLLAFIAKHTDPTKRGGR